MKKYDVYFWVGTYECGYCSNFRFVAKNENQARNDAENYIKKSKLDSMRIEGIIEVK